MFVPPNTSGSESNGSPVIVKITYGQLITTHVLRSRLNKKGAPRPEKSIENIESTIKRWRETNGISLESPVGMELGLGFRESLKKYLDGLAGEYSKQYVRDVKSRLEKLRETYLEILKADSLPRSFTASIRYLCELHDMSVCDLEEKLATKRLISKWVYNNQLPREEELLQIYRIEDYFSLARNTLASKLPPYFFGSKQKSRKAGTTEWRENLSSLHKLAAESGIRVWLPAFEGRLSEECHDLYQFYTDNEWLREHGLHRNSRWSEREDGYCGTADKWEGGIRSYLGFLRLPNGHPDARLNGRGYLEKDLSLALFSSTQDVFAYVKFVRARTPENVLSTTVKMMLETCKTLLKKGDGFLWQQPHYGERLPTPVPARKWRGWCNNARQAIKKALDDYEKEDLIRITRKALELVKPIVRELDSPLDVVDLMLDRMESSMEYVQGEVNQAVARRDHLLIKLESCIPLRAYNVSLLTYTDDNEGSFRTRPDGTWWLFIPKEHFKNRRRKDLNDFNVQIEDQELIEALGTYMRDHRKHLLGGAKCEVCAAAKLEGKESDCPAAKATGAMCEWTDYIFRPMVTGRKGQKALEPWNPGAISRRVYDLTRDFLPEYPGFSIHWFRHLLASDYIKNHPEGFGVAAMLLHDTEATVRKYYAWVEPRDGVRVYNLYRRERKKQREQNLLAA